MPETQTMTLTEARAVLSYVAIHVSPPHANHVQYAEIIESAIRAIIRDERGRR